jgi:hypothetical protein
LWAESGYSDTVGKGGLAVLMLALCVTMLLMIGSVTVGSLYGLSGLRMGLDRFYARVQCLKPLHARHCGDAGQGGECPVQGFDTVVERVDFF